MRSNHNIYIGASQQMTQTKDSSIDLVVTSPPDPMIEMWDEIMISQNTKIADYIQKEPDKAFELIHKELKPRKIRLVCVNMGIDLNCAKMTAIDELIISNFSFAAQLEKQLISERTLSALEVKRKQGIKFGAASEKYKSNRTKKDKNILKHEYMEKGRMKRERWQSKKETQMFAQIIRKEFPDHCTSDDITKWEWLGISCKRPHLDRMLDSMAEYKSIDKSLFVKWDFSKSISDNAQSLRSYMQRFKRSYGIV